MVDQLYEEGFARLYDTHWALSTDVAEALRVGLPPKPGGATSVLDVGCGGGKLVELLANAGYTATGIDPSVALLDSARTRLAGPVEAGRVKLVEGDVCTMDLGSKFDCILSTYYVLNHLSRDLLAQALERMVAHLAEGGIIVSHIRPKRDAMVKDGQVSVAREFGGLIVRRYLWLGGDEHMMYHEGYFADEKGACVPFEFKWRHFVYASSDYTAWLEKLGVSCTMALDVSTTQPGSADIRPIALDEADNANELVLVSTRRPEDLAVLAERLLEG